MITLEASLIDIAQGHLGYFLKGARTLTEALGGRGLPQRSTPSRGLHRH